MNHHFGELGDVWKHLPLAEILRVYPPRHYWETHAGSATYPLKESPARLHGALRFLEYAPRDPELTNCAYLEALQEMPGIYPGSPRLAMRALGQEARYIFCDIDPKSAASLRIAVAGLHAHVFEGDGVSVISHEAQLGRVDPAEVLVVIDPFNPYVLLGLARVDFEQENFGSSRDAYSKLEFVDPDLADQFNVLTGTGPDAL